MRTVQEHRNVTAPITMFTYAIRLILKYIIWQEFCDIWSHESFQLRIFKQNPG